MGATFPKEQLDEKKVKAARGKFPVFIAHGKTDNAIPVTVNVMEVLGDKMDVHMSAGDDTALVARVDAQEPLEERQKQQMYLDIEKVHFFEPGDAGENLCLGGVSAGVQT